MLKSAYIFMPILCLTFNCLAQANKSEPKIFYYSNADLLEDYEQLNLDASHVNLLNPEEAKTEINNVIESWRDLHQQIGKHLKARDFTWNTEDENIEIVQKIYFDKTGKITHYFFRIFNEDITDQTRANFAEQLRDFAKTNKIAIERNEQFAQCGKTRYAN